MIVQSGIQKQALLTAALFDLGGQATAYTIGKMLTNNSYGRPLATSILQTLPTLVKKKYLAEQNGAYELTVQGKVFLRSVTAAMAYTYRRDFNLVTYVGWQHMVKLKERIPCYEKSGHRSYVYVALLSNDAAETASKHSQKCVYVGMTNLNPPSLLHGLRITCGAIKLVVGFADMACVYCRSFSGIGIHSHIMKRLRWKKNMPMN